MAKRKWWENIHHNPRFRVIRQLGEGTTSVVLFCEDRLSGKTVSLKIFNPASPDISTTISRAMMVMAKLERIRSPLFCNVTEITKINGSYTFVQEYISATPLSRVIDCTTHSIDEWLQLILGILKGLHILHSSGVIHGNLTSGNVLVTPAFEPVLMDIGIVPRCGNCSSLDGKSLYGSLDIMAPEYIEGSPLHAQGDIYAIGWLLWRLITGENPHIGKSIDEKLAFHHNETTPDPHQINPNIHDEIAKITMKCLEKKLDSRYSDVSQIISDIFVLYFGRKFATDRIELKKVLIVDDEKSIRDLFQQLFDILGFQTFTASNGREGIEKAIEIRPDLICLDIMMPDLSGLEVAEILFGNPLTASIPIVFITARNDHDYMIYSRALGIRDYLVKPVSINDIETRISFWLQPTHKKKPYNVKR